MDETITIETWWCGCCGNVAAYSNRIELWCPRCVDHLLPSSGWCPDRGEAIPAEDRTWFAQTGRDCPFTPIYR